MCARVLGGRTSNNIAVEVVMGGGASAGKRKCQLLRRTWTGVAGFLTFLPV